MWPKMNKYESTWEVLLEPVRMTSPHSTAVGERQPSASGRHHIEEAFLGMQPTQMKAEPNKERARPSNTEPLSPVMPEAIDGWDSR